MTAKSSNKGHASSDSDGYFDGVRPGLKWAVIIMGIMLIVGIGVIITTIIYRTVKLSSGKSVSKVVKVDPYPDINLPIAKSGRVTSVDLDGNRMAFKVVEDEKTTIYIVDVKKGQVLSKVILNRPE